MPDSDSKNVLLIQGDSLTLPRNSVPYIQTWPGLLQQNLPEYHVVNIGQSEKTTNDFSGSLEAHHKRELEYYEPRVVVVQIGIVDCAPRYFRRWEKQLLDLIPVDMISNGLFFLAKHLRNRSKKRAYINQKTFRANLESYCCRTENISADRVVLVKILQPGKELAEKNPQIGECVTEYNTIIQDIADQFDNVEAIRPLDDDLATERAAIENNTLSDGYHLNRKGHQRLFQRLPFSRENK